MMQTETRQQVNKIITKAEKVNETSVYLKDLKDAKESNKEKQAKIAITKYKSWKRS